MDADIERRYFLPEAYQVNSAASSNDNNRSDFYWNRKRLKRAGYYQYPVYKICRSLIRDLSIGSIIDVGCGVATKLAYLNRVFPHLDILGIDQRHPIEFCRENYKFGSWQVDNFENPDPDLAVRQAPLVICADVIEHVNNPNLLLDYLSTRCSEDGVIVVSTPERVRLSGYGKLSPENRDHIREWSASEFSDYLISRGFRIRQHSIVSPVKVGVNKCYIKTLLKNRVRGSHVNNSQFCVIEKP